MRITPIGPALSVWAKTTVRPNHAIKRVLLEVERDERGERGERGVLDTCKVATCTEPLK